MKDLKLLSVVLCALSTTSCQTRGFNKGPDNASTQAVATDTSFRVDPFGFVGKADLPRFLISANATEFVRRTCPDSANVVTEDTCKRDVIRAPLAKVKEQYTSRIDNIVKTSKLISRYKNEITELTALRSKHETELSRLKTGNTADPIVAKQISRHEDAILDLNNNIKRTEERLEGVKNYGEKFIEHSARLLKLVEQDGTIDFAKLNPQLLPGEIELAAQILSDVISELSTDPIPAGLTLKEWRGSGLFGTVEVGQSFKKGDIVLVSQGKLLSLEQVVHNQKNYGCLVFVNEDISPGTLALGVRAGLFRALKWNEGKGAFQTYLTFECGDRLVNETGFGRVAGHFSSLKVENINEAGGQLFKFTPSRKPTLQPQDNFIGTLVF